MVGCWVDCGEEESQELGVVDAEESESRPQSTPTYLRYVGVRFFWRRSRPFHDDKYGDMDLRDSLASMMVLRGNDDT